MAKIGIAATKYIIKAKLAATGVVEKPDVIGAIFGQTEGLLGEELDLRELQKSGRIGRIEVNVESKEGKSEGVIEIPTSLNREDTALIAAALETIERIGPCDSKIEIVSVEDVRSTKRDYVVERAKTLLGEMEKTTPESQELTELVKEKARTAEIVEIGPDKLPAGPEAETSNEIILVEGRADVVNLVKHGIQNVIGLGGTSIPNSIKDICSQKEVTVFLDGDRGGDLILKELLQIADVDFVARAPAGREVEELTGKEIIKALRTKITKEQVLKALSSANNLQAIQVTEAQPQAYEVQYHRKARTEGVGYSRRSGTMRPTTRTTLQYREEFKAILKFATALAGTGQAALLKQVGTNFREVGRVPRSDILDVIKNLPVGKAQALVVDGELDQSLANEVAAKGIIYLIGEKKPRFLKRKPGVYVLESGYLKRVVEEYQKEVEKK